MIRYIDYSVIIPLHSVETIASVTRDHPCTLRELTCYSHENERWCSRLEVAMNTDTTALHLHSGTGIHLYSSEVMWGRSPSGAGLSRVAFEPNKTQNLRTEIDISIICLLDLVTSRLNEKSLFWSIKPFGRNLFPHLS